MARASAQTPSTLSTRPNGTASGVVRDGVEGPEFDDIEIISEHFSDDSQHVSYAGQRGEKYVGVVDGMATPEYDQMYRVNFSPDSKRTCYYARRDKWIPVVDGVEVRSTKISGTSLSARIPNGWSSSRSVTASG